MPVVSRSRNRGEVAGNRFSNTEVRILLRTLVRVELERNVSRPAPEDTKCVKALLLALKHYFLQP
jgi:hypothetical protein